MTPKKRRAILFTLLAASVCLVALGDGLGTRGASEVVEPPEKMAPAQRRIEHPPFSGKANIRELQETNMIGEIQPRAASPEPDKAFAVHDWTPPAPPAPSAPPPTAPPLPFAFLGKKFEDGQWQVFLGQEDKTFIVREADSIDDLYRVDSIRPPVMSITYLPLRQPQTLTIGDTP